MKIFNKLVLVCFLCMVGVFTSAQIPAFPGACGGGMFASGGRGGRVLYVTSLADDNSEGTLRWAVSQKGPRTILFKVSGIISLEKTLNIKEPNLTIAGQSAPGDGICIKNHGVFIAADNVIIRFIRFRLGNELIHNESDAVGGRNCKNVIIDHCSMSWSIDECASFYSNENFTLQWCIVSESLNNAGHAKGAHGYGGIWGGKNASFHHNLIAHNVSRNPRFNGWKREGLKYNTSIDEERVDFRNNVIFNWGDNSSYGGENGKYNIVGNYFKYGPATKPSARFRITQIDMDSHPEMVSPGFGQYFIEKNFVYNCPECMEDNWECVSYAEGVDKQLCKVTQPFECTPVIEQPVEIAYKKVLQFAGASFKRDAVDKRIAKETFKGKVTYKGSISGRPGIIDSQNDVGGWPVYRSNQPYPDSNQDGIPDGWLEKKHPGKSATDFNEEGYTYLEVYLNSLVEKITQSEYAGALSNKL